MVTPVPSPSPLRCILGVSPHGTSYRSYCSYATDTYLPLHVNRPCRLPLYYSVTPCLLATTCSQPHPSSLFNRGSRIVVHRLVDVRSVPSVPYATRTTAYTPPCLPGPVVHHCTSVHSYLLHTVQLYSSLPLYQWEPSSLRYATRHSTTALSRYTATMAYGRDASHPLMLRTRSLPLLVLADARPPYAPSHRLLPSTRSSKSTLRLLVTLTYRTSPLRYTPYRSHLRYLDSSFSFVVLSALPRDSRLGTLRSALSIPVWEIGESPLRRTDRHDTKPDSCAQHHRYTRAWHTV